MEPKKRVLVTGASKGIGRATLDYLHAEGYRVTGVARTRPDGLLPGQEFYTLDLNDLPAVSNLISELAREAPFYGLVNNAAVAPPTTRLKDTRPQDISEAVHLNLNAPLVCAKAVLAGMRDLGEGRIVNLSSRAALGKVNRTAYSATKAGIVGMSRTWALELACDAITVNAIAPGPIATEFFRKNSAVEDIKTKALINGIPLNRMGEPTEVAHAISFLLHRYSGFMTGQTLYIDGGLTVSVVKL